MAQRPASIQPQAPQLYCLVCLFLGGLHLLGCVYTVELCSQRSQIQDQAGRFFWIGVLLFDLISGPGELGITTFVFGMIFNSNNKLFP